MGYLMFIIMILAWLLKGVDGIHFLFFAAIFCVAGALESIASHIKDGR